MGVFVALFQFTFFFALFNFLTIGYLLASVISFVTTVLVSFALQSRYVFITVEGKKFTTPVSVLLMYLNALLGLGINTLIMYIGVEMISDLPELWQVVSMVVLACYNYVVYSFIFQIK